MLLPQHPRISKEGWLSPVEGTRLEIERRVKPTVGSNPTPSANPLKADLIISRGMRTTFDCLRKAQFKKVQRSGTSKAEPAMQDNPTPSAILLMANPMSFLSLCIDCTKFSAKDRKFPFRSFHPEKN